VSHIDISESKSNVSDTSIIITEAELGHEDKVSVGFDRAFLNLGERACACKQH
jgi:hypothetical protein